MKSSKIREMVMEEIRGIPEEKLPQIFDIIHHFRIGLEVAKSRESQIHDYSGCWKDMPEDMYQDFLNEVNQRRRKAFSGRRNFEASVG